MIKKKVVDISKVVGKGYGQFWKDKEHRYIVCKGSRASKKSVTASLWIIYHMMKYPLANTLVVRRVYNTLQDSVYVTLKQATQMLGVEHLWKFSKKPLKATYLPSGNCILFRGLDNADSITSIAVEHGVLCWCLFEEFYQIEKEDDFNKIDLSIRDPLPEGYFYRIMGILNPWHESWWGKKRFFDNPDKDTLALTTTYKCNEFLSPEIVQLMDDLYITNPKRASVECSANWGVSQGLVYDNWRVKDFDLSKLDNKNQLIDLVGLDYGWTDQQALVQIALDKDNKRIYVYDEEYEQYQTLDQLLEMIKDKGLERKLIHADSNKPETTNWLNTHGCKVKSVKKGKGSILLGITWIQDYEIIIHPSCVNFQREIALYRWKEAKDGSTVQEPIDKDNHLMDSFRYALNDYITEKKKSRIRSW